MFFISIKKISLFLNEILKIVFSLGKYVNFYLILFVYKLNNFS